MTLVRRLAGWASLSLACLLALAFHDRYWRWRYCFNDLGRCWDSETEQVYVEQAGIVWGGLTALFLGLALYLLRPRIPRIRIGR